MAACCRLVGAGFLFLVACAAAEVENCPAGPDVDGECSALCLIQTQNSLLPKRSTPHQPSSAILSADAKGAGADAEGAGGQEFGRAWQEATSVLVARGAVVNPVAQGNVTFHGGVSIRGVVARNSLAEGEFLLKIPRALQLTSANLPDLNPAVAGTKECDGLSVPHMELAAGVAVERKKGNSSVYHAYLKSLPTLEDYRSFHPRLMSAKLQWDFAGLPLTQAMASGQVVDKQYVGCFKKWKKAQESHLVQGLRSKDFSLALTQVRTRCYGMGSETIGLVPASDLLNTASTEKLNTIWFPLGGPEKDVFELLTVGSVRAGEELYDPYCPDCGNDNMMSIWGVYLEDNNVLPADRSQADCKQLRPATEAALDLDSGKAAGLAAPRCKAETMASPEQGPLRCSLARLSWESCSDNWASKGAADQDVMLVQEGSGVRLSAAERVRLIDRSAIHRVNPALVRGGRRA